MSEPNFLNSGEYGCVFNPAYNCDGKKTKNNKYITKLVQKDFFSKTEYDVGKLMSNKEGFSPIIKRCNISNELLKESSMSKHCKVNRIKKYKKDYELLYSKFIKSIKLSTFLNNTLSKYDILKSYIVLCKRIEVMIETGVIHHDLHFGNILYDGSDMYIIDFGLSLIKKSFLINKQINMTYLKKAIFEYSPTWNYWSIDFHLLCFIVHNQQMITMEIIEHTINYYLNHHIINKIKGGYSFFYKQYAINYFKKYIDQPIDYVIKELLNTSETWDYYKIAIHYIEIYYDILMKTPQFLIILLLLIHPNPEYRPNSLEIRLMNDTLMDHYQYNNNSIKREFSNKIIKSLNSSMK